MSVKGRISVLVRGRYWRCARSSTLEDENSSIARMRQRDNVGTASR